MLGVEGLDKVDKVIKNDLMKKKLRFQYKISKKD